MGVPFRPPQAAEKILGFGDQFALIFALEIDQIAPKPPNFSPAARLHYEGLKVNHFLHGFAMKNRGGNLVTLVRRPGPGAAGPKNWGFWGIYKGKTLKKRVKNMVRKKTHHKHLARFCEK